MENDYYIVFLKEDEVPSCYSLMYTYLKEEIWEVVLSFRGDDFLRVPVNFVKDYKLPPPNEFEKKLFLETLKVYRDLNYLMEERVVEFPDGCHYSYNILLKPLKEREKIFRDSIKSLKKIVPEVDHKLLVFLISKPTLENLVYLDRDTFLEMFKKREILYKQFDIISDYLNGKKEIPPSLKKHKNPLRLIKALITYEKLKK